MKEEIKEADRIDVVVSAEDEGTSVNISMEDEDGNTKAFIKYEFNQVIQLVAGLVQVAEALAENTAKAMVREVAKRANKCECGAFAGDED